jgi:hypothetical protein
VREKKRQKIFDLQKEERERSRYPKSDGPDFRNGMEESWIGGLFGRE